MIIRNVQICTMNIIKIIDLVSPQLLAQSFYKKKWQSPKHINFIENKLIEVYGKGNKRLIINMPPRHGKSQFITKIFPLWWLLNRPDNRIIISAYNSNLAEYFGREILDIFKKISPKYGINLNNSQKSKTEFVTNKNGSISAVGVGGSLTGKGADLIIVDDPIKNDAEANSTNARDSIYDWFTATLMTRLEPNGSIILVMTRWHEDDLSGRLLKLNNWDSVIFPAIAITKDELGRNIGDALWEKRFNKAKLMEIKQNLGNFWFSGLYQQTPTPAEGGIFKKSDFRYLDIVDGIAKSKDFVLDLTGLDIYFSCDLAISISEDSDYTVIAIFATDNERNLLLIDLFREKVLPSKHFDIIKKLYEKYKPILIGVESVQYQAILYHQLNNIGLPVTKLIPKKDKVSRALPLAAKLESGKVFFASSISSLGDIENELLNFPRAKHDDIVDALAYAVEMLSATSANQPVGFSKVKNSLLRGF